MTKLNSVFKTTCLLLPIFAMLSTQSMEHSNGLEYLLDLDFYDHFRSYHHAYTQSIKITHNKTEKRKEHIKNAALAKEHNDTLYFIQLPRETLFQIFDYCHTQDIDPATALEKSIKNLIKMSGACKKFNNLLSVEKIGKLCEWYNLEIKNKALLKVLDSINDPRYKIMRLPASILVSSGADANVTTEHQSDYLLECAIMYNDIEFAEKLLQHKADPNPKHLRNPIFFWSKNKTMTQLLVDHGLNVHVTELRNTDPNILWRVINSDYPSDLMAYYLELSVDPKVMWGRNCILHRLAKPSSLYIKDIDELLKKAKLLLDVMSEMINHQDKWKRTALDLAYESFEIAKKYGTPEAFEQLIALFRKHGAFTTKELKDLKTNS